MLRLKCPLNSPEQMEFIIAGKLMFPNPKDVPACPVQSLVHQPVAGLVAGEFLFPKRTVAGGLRAVLGTTMPETPVHKKCEFEFEKNKIRFAEHRLMSPPASDFVSLKKLCQRNFRGLVAARANKRHHFRTLGFGENVRHLRVRRNQRPATGVASFPPPGVETTMASLIIKAAVRR